MEEITSTGHELIESKHYALSKYSILFICAQFGLLIIFFFFFQDRIQLRMDEIVHLWENLVTASGQKGSKLREAAQQQQFNRTVEDIELWLSEVEGQLLSEDYGKVINFFFITHVINPINNFCNIILRT